MANLNSYKIDIKDKKSGKIKKSVEVQPAAREDANWKVSHKGGFLFFDKKESVRSYFERKNPSCEIED